jgi:hypothetical protein
MFVRQPQFRNASADVQIYYGDSPTTTAARYYKSWNKPPGVSHIYMMLIGGGGNGDGVTGGASGAVTVWYGAAQNVPDSLEVLAGFGGTTSIVRYRGTSLSTLLQANSASTITPGTATTANQFAASGYYQSIAGQAGTSAGGPGPSNTTFLSGGGTGGITTNYGYTTDQGFFQLQPIIVGGGSGSYNNQRSGIGCGGAINGVGGQGMVLIASW